MKIISVLAPCLALTALLAFGGSASAMEPNPNIPRHVCEAMTERLSNVATLHSSGLMEGMERGNWAYDSLSAPYSTRQMVNLGIYYVYDFMPRQVRHINGGQPLNFGDFSTDSYALISPADVDRVLTDVFNCRAGDIAEAVRELGLPMHRGSIAISESDPSGHRVKILSAVRQREGTIRVKASLLSFDGDSMPCEFTVGDQNETVPWQVLRYRMQKGR